MRALLLASLAILLAACGGGRGAGVRTTQVGSRITRVAPDFSCIRIEDASDGAGLDALETLADAGLKFYRLPAPVRPASGPGTRCVGLFEWKALAVATLDQLDPGDLKRSTLVIQHLSPREVAQLPVEARQFAYVSAPHELEGEDAPGPIGIDRSSDGQTILLYNQELERGDVQEGRLYVLNERVGRLEIFAAWDYLLHEGKRLLYGTGRVIADAQSPSRTLEGRAARELGTSAGRLREASFFDRTSATTQVVTLASYDPGSGRAEELGLIGGGTLAVSGGQVVFSARPIWWEIEHEGSAGNADAAALAHVEVRVLPRSGREPQLLRGAAATLGRQALLERYAGRERGLMDGVIERSPEGERMGSELSVPDGDQVRRRGDLLWNEAQVMREVRVKGKSRRVVLFEGALRALTRSGRYAMVRLASGRFVAVHLL